MAKRRTRTNSRPTVKDLDLFIQNFANKKANNRENIYIEDIEQAIKRKYEATLGAWEFRLFEIKEYKRWWTICKDRTLFMACFKSQCFFVSLYELCEFLKKKFEVNDLNKIGFSSPLDDFTIKRWFNPPDEVTEVPTVTLVDGLCALNLARRKKKDKKVEPQDVAIELANLKAVAGARHLCVSIREKLGYPIKLLLEGYREEHRAIIEARKESVTLMARKLKKDSTFMIGAERRAQKEIVQDLQRKALQKLRKSSAPIFALLKQEQCKKVLMRDLKSLGLESLSWQRLADLEAAVLKEIFPTAAAYLDAAVDSSATVLSTIAENSDLQSLLPLMHSAACHPADTVLPEGDPDLDNVSQVIWRELKGALRERLSNCNGDLTTLPEMIQDVEEALHTRPSAIIHQLQAEKFSRGILPLLSHPSVLFRAVCFVRSQLLSREVELNDQGWNDIVSLALAFLDKTIHWDRGMIELIGEIARDIDVPNPSIFGAIAYEKSTLDVIQRMPEENEITEASSLAFQLIASAPPMTELHQYLSWEFRFSSLLGSLVQFLCSTDVTQEMFSKKCLLFCGNGEIFICKRDQRLELSSLSDSLGQLPTEFASSLCSFIAQREGLPLNEMEWKRIMETCHLNPQPIVEFLLNIIAILPISISVTVVNAALSPFLRHNPTINRNFITESIHASPSLLHRFTLISGVCNFSLDEEQVLAEASVDGPPANYSSDFESDKDDFDDAELEFSDEEYIIPSSSHSHIEREDIDERATLVDDKLEQSLLRHEPRQVIDDIRSSDFGIGQVVAENPTFQKQQERQQRALERLSHQLYSEQLHFLLELIQNADDNEYPPTEACPTLTFHVTSRDICVLNNEIGFQEKNIRALCEIGKSTKVGRTGQGYIGCKGIGWKSVFLISDAPEVHSRGYHVKFDRNGTEDCKLGFIVPEWIESCSICSSDHQSGVNTLIRLPFSERFTDAAAPNKLDSEVIQQINIQPSLLIFVHKLMRIHVVIHHGDIWNEYSIQKRIRGSHIVEVAREERKEGELSTTKMRWFVGKSHVKVSPKATEGEPSRAGVSGTEVVIAFPLVCELISSDDALSPVPKHRQWMLEAEPSQQDVFAFLPLRGYNFRFLLQADWILPSSREAIDKNSSWNQWLGLQVPDAFMNAFRKMRRRLVSVHDPNSSLLFLNRFLQYIPGKWRSDDFFFPAVQEIHHKLQREEWLDDTSGKPRAPLQLVIATKEEMELISVEKFEQYRGKYYVSPALDIPLHIQDVLHIRKMSINDVIQTLRGNCASDEFKSLLDDRMDSDQLQWLLSFLEHLRNRISRLPSEADRRSAINALQQVPLWPLLSGPPPFKYCLSSITDGKIYFASSKEEMNGLQKNSDGNAPYLSSKSLRELDNVRVLRDDFVAELSPPLRTFLRDLGLLEISPNDGFNIICRRLENQSTATPMSPCTLRSFYSFLVQYCYDWFEPSELVVYANMDTLDRDVPDHLLSSVQRILRLRACASVHCVGKADPVFFARNEIHVQLKFAQSLCPCPSLSNVIEDWYIEQPLWSKYRHIFHCLGAFESVNIKLVSLPNEGKSSKTHLVTSPEFERLFIRNHADRDPSTSIAVLQRLMLVWQEVYWPIIVDKRCEAYNLSEELSQRQLLRQLKETEWLFVTGTWYPPRKFYVGDKLPHSVQHLRLLPDRFLNDFQPFWTNIGCRNQLRVDDVVEILRALRSKMEDDSLSCLVHHIDDKRCKGMKEEMKKHHRLFASLYESAAQADGSGILRTFQQEALLFVNGKFYKSSEVYYTDNTKILLSWGIPILAPTYAKGLTCNDINLEAFFMNTGVAKAPPLKLYAYALSNRALKEHQRPSMIKNEVAVILKELSSPDESQEIFHDFSALRRYHIFPTLTDGWACACAQESFMDDPNLHVGRKFAENFEKLQIADGSTPSVRRLWMRLRGKTMRQELTKEPTFGGLAKKEEVSRSIFSTFPLIQRYLVTHHPDTELLKHSQDRLPVVLRQLDVFVVDFLQIQYSLNGCRVITDSLSAFSEHKLYVTTKCVKFKKWRDVMMTLLELLQLSLDPKEEARLSGSLSHFLLSGDTEEAEIDMGLQDKSLPEGMVAWERTISVNPNANAAPDYFDIEEVSDDEQHDFYEPAKVELPLDDTQEVVESWPPRAPGDVPLSQVFSHARISPLSDGTPHETTLGHRGDRLHPTSETDCAAAEQSDVCGSSSGYINGNSRGVNNSSGGSRELTSGPRHGDPQPLQLQLNAVSVEGISGVISIDEVISLPSASEVTDLIGRSGECAVFDLLKNYPENGLPWEHVVWENDETESGKPYDFRVRRADSDQVEFIEVKSSHSTEGGRLVPFSIKELQFACEHRDGYHLYRYFTQTGTLWIVSAIMTKGKITPYVLLNDTRSGSNSIP